MSEENVDVPCAAQEETITPQPVETVPAEAPAAATPEFETPSTLPATPKVHKHRLPASPGRINSFSMNEPQAAKALAKVAELNLAGARMKKNKNETRKLHGVADLAKYLLLKEIGEGV